MPENGIDWIKRFGKRPDEMDEGEWRMAASVLLIEGCQNKNLLLQLKTFYMVAVILWPVLTAAVAWIAITLIGHLAH